MDNHLKRPLAGESEQKGKFSRVGSVAALLLPVPMLIGLVPEPAAMVENLRLIKMAVMSVSQKLYIYNVFPPQQPYPLMPLLDVVQQYYSAATSTDYKIDVNVLFSGLSMDLTHLHDVEVVLGCSEDDEAISGINVVRMQRELEALRLVHAVDHSLVPRHMDTPFPGVQHKLYRNVCLGGTYDRLHGGHKLMLTAAALVCTGRLTVGVTGAEMLRAKRFAELITSYKERASIVLRFLSALKPHLSVFTVELQDVVGPAGTDPELGAIVLSPETLGAEATVNAARSKAGLNALEAISVEFVGGVGERVSSSWLREQASKVHVALRE